MSDIDEILARIGAQPVHSGLAGLEETVFAGMARLRERQAQRRTVTLAGVLALGLGLAGAGIPGMVMPNAARPGVAVASLTAPPALAPSSLLAVQE